MKTGTWIVLGLVLATIVYQVIERVPAQTLSVMLGVACGIGASIPVVAGLLIALLRRRPAPEMYVETREVEPAPARVQAYPAPQHIGAAPLSQPPQIIVLSPNGQFAPGQFPPGFQFPAQWLNAPYPALHEHANAVDAREWRIIGEE